MILTSENIEALATALAKAQGELSEAIKDSVNPAFKSKYADLASVLAVIRPVASKYGLSYVQALGYHEGFVEVTTRLMHSSGQFLQSTLDVPVTKKDAQGLGSGASYGRRYSLSAIFGIGQDDDDGNSAAQAKTGSKGQTQGPVKGDVLDLGPVVGIMTAKFEAVKTDDEMRLLTNEWANLTPMEQAQILPAAKAARTRLEAAKSKTQV